MKVLLEHIIICLCFLIFTCNAQTPYYYTGPSITINSNSCPVTICAQCATGYYNEMCGLDASKLNTGGCKPCTGLPANAEWLPWGPSPDGIYPNSSICDKKWACKSQYVLTNGNCIQGNCSIPVQNSELTIGASYPNCTTQCKAGYFGGSAVNPSDCTVCALGTYSASGSTVCNQCPKGTYLDTTGGKGVSDCKTTQPGQYTDTTGSATFKYCPAGTYSAAVGANSSDTCVPCTKGNYCPTGSPAPTPCQKGTYNSNTGSSSIAACLQCPAATYMSTTGASVCTNCPAGKYLGAQGATDLGNCTACTLGNYCLEASVTPTPCSAGTYNAVLNGASAAACLPCNAPQYSVAQGAVSCQTCQVCSTGQYKSGCGGSNAGSCMTCSNLPP